MNRFFIILLLSVFTLQLSAQNIAKKATFIKEGKFTYEIVEGDPLKTRIYKLQNGLTIYLSVYKDSPRIQTYVAVRAGSKNDPSHATGLAHYLEHILFKGTSKIGTINWEKEKNEIDKIEQLYEVYRGTKDEEKRKQLYQKIDSISLVAASFAVANEYDKLVSTIGATGTNAYTFLEQTVYVNEIPSNQLEKWLSIEAERFSQVVPRLFHTELEAVYEEKNKGMDVDSRKVYEQMMASLFQKHTYGTQTTIGTVEHLKNPSITEIKKYFNTYYVPNNMAICLSGDLDPEQTIAWIDKKFSSWKPKPVPKFTPAIESPIVQPIKNIILGPDAENLTLAYRLPGNKTKESLMGELMSMVLTNGQAGLIDLNLNQQQKVLSASAYSMRFNDYSVFALSGKPKQGQSLDELKSLLLSQIDLVKKGAFDEWLLKAIINDYKIYKMKEQESNKARADLMVDAFIAQRPWAEVIGEVEAMSKITKPMLVDFANQFFISNYVEIQKLTGKDTSIVKVPKPTITPISINRDTISDFYKNINKLTAPSINPVFLDFEKDLTKLKIKSDIPLLYKKNQENSIFQLTIAMDMGRDSDPMLSLAIDYLDYLGTEKFNAEQLKQEFYKLGCTFTIAAGADATSISISGLNENFNAAFLLLHSLLSNAKEDETALGNLVSRILKSRQDAKLSKGAIMNGGLVNYAKYGLESPFRNILSEQELKNIKPAQLLEIIKSLLNYQHRILYYGPLSSEILVASLNQYHKVGSELKPVKQSKKYVFKDMDENTVYWVDYDMVQAEIVLLSKSVNYNKELVAKVNLYNEYFGGGMGSLVFQEMRESKALAYAVRSTYQNAARINDPNYNFSYIGTQADKIHEAIDGMLTLLNDMPESASLFSNAKDYIVENINTQRITKASVLATYESSKKLGIDYDLRKDIYQWVKSAKFEDIKKFQNDFVKGKNRTMLVIGSKNKIDFSSLSKYGKVKELSKEEIFGY